MPDRCERAAHSIHSRNTIAPPSLECACYPLGDTCPHAHLRRPQTRFAPPLRHQPRAAPGLVPLFPTLYEAHAKCYKRHVYVYVHYLGLGRSGQSGAQKGQHASCCASTSAVAHEGFAMYQSAGRARAGGGGARCGEAMLRDMHNERGHVHPRAHEQGAEPRSVTRQMRHDCRHPSASSTLMGAAICIPPT
ncbi:hypothetical protein HYPSUDRAFT_198887 [Hypholoma sublateritium FD-334 SS-4]|uniref:Uncharacterized protein n=1 Tax=Hypholoma sublateritium (strain FD-334 SS-4) TaxID=945553 RepID=A0A0D2Q4X8_HYPSF|nr:hypothetical protein HYPSUDRAFT_198887 [Hypholoma sublateritium FD-334 SS-4]